MHQIRSSLRSITSETKGWYECKHFLILKNLSTNPKLVLRKFKLDSAEHNCIPLAGMGRRGAPVWSGHRQLGCTSGWHPKNGCSLIPKKKYNYRIWLTWPYHTNSPKGPFWISTCTTRRLCLAFSSWSLFRLVAQQNKFLQWNISTAERIHVIAREFRETSWQQSLAVESCCSGC